MNPSTRRIALTAIVALGLALRLGAAAALGLGEPPAPGSDQKEYDTYAWNLAQGRGYRGMSPDVADRDHLTAYRPPGTSLAWAGIYRVVGRRYEAIRLFHCLVGAATILLVYHIGRDCGGEAVGLTAASAFAAYPLGLLYTSELLSETLGTFWLLAAVLACLRLAERPSWGRAILAGGLLGLALLTRLNVTLLLPLVAAWGIWQLREAPRGRLMGLAVPAVAVGVLVPWAVRNYLIFHAFIPFSTMGGSVLLQGNNRIVVTDPKFYGGSPWDTAIPEYRDALRSAGSELERDRVARKFAVEWLRDHPGDWPFLAQAKLRRAWTPFLQPHAPLLYRAALLASWGPILLLSGLAFLPTLALFLRAGHPGWLLHLVLLGYTLTSLIFFGNPRYRFPVEPLCMVLAAMAAWSIAAALARGGPGWGVRFRRTRATSIGAT